MRYKLKLINMRRNLGFLVVILLCMLHGYAQQQRQSWVEDFDGSFPPANWTANPAANAWTVNRVLHLPGSGAGTPQSIVGFVPNSTNSTITLETQVYDCTDYRYVYLQFDHICKVSFLDEARLEYRIEMGASMGRWQTVPWSAYRGASTTYSLLQHFDAGSYDEWKMNDSTALPAQSWWKEESFDLWNEAGMHKIQFRFVIRHNGTPGTQASYGWLIENFRLTAAKHEIAYPVVQLLKPFLKDTIYSTGPFEINAMVKTTSSAPLKTPFLKYEATRNGLPIASDSVEMIHVEDSLWKAGIPKFEAGVTVTYAVIGTDTFTNTTTADSQYEIVLPHQGMSDYVIIGTETYTSNDYPISLQNSYSWSRQIYLASELEPNASAGGTITHLAWDYINTMAGFTKNNQKCYFKAVDDMQCTSVNWINPATDGATLVWSGNLTPPAGRIWTDIALTTPFDLPAGKNLMVYWVDSSGSYYGMDYRFYVHSTIPINRTAYNRSAVASAIITNNGYLSTSRANARFWMISNYKPLEHSVALNSMDMSQDTVIVEPGLEVPIIVTIENTGTASLDSATFSYSISGGTPKDTLIRFVPALSWDHTRQLTIGSYIPNTGTWDTLTVWVSLPNGQHDSLNSDDTLVKRIYGSIDLVLQFTNVPSDTVNATGPYDMEALVYAPSGATLTSIPSLSVAHTIEGITTHENLTMQQIDARTWTVRIPKLRYGTTVTYTLRGSDTLGNEQEITGSYYIQQPTVEVESGYVFIGNGTVGNAQYAPYHRSFRMSYSRNYYMSYEINPNNMQGGTITSIAYYNTASATSASNVEKVSFYFKATTDSANTSTAYIDPVADGATLVWGPATVSTSGTGWVNLDLDTPFNLSPGMNLLVYCNNRDSVTTGNGTVTYQYTATGKSNISVHVFGDVAWPLTTTSNSYKTISGNRPNIRLYVQGNPPPAYSVALTAINTPEKTSLAGSPATVNVTITNRGMADMDSCLIGWTFNGDTMPLTAYKRTLYSDFSDTITLQGDYMPVFGKEDTIIVWVSKPNDVTDINTDDDRLSIITLGCSAPLQGNISVGAGEEYPNITSVLQLIRNCGVANDITLILANGEYQESIDLTDISNFMQGYSLTILSASGKRDSVIIRPTAKEHIVALSNSHNITFKNITLHRDSVHIIEFTGNAGNITFDSCVIKSSRTIKGGSPYYGIQKNTASEFNSITVKHCLIDGGNRGINIYMTNAGGRSNAVGVVIDSNVFIYQENAGIYTEYLRPQSISHNTISPRDDANTQGTSWYGIRLYEARNVAGVSRIVGNSISARENITGIWSSIYGIYAYYTDTVLIANNEIFLSLNPSTSYNTEIRGINIDYPFGIYVCHNTVYTKTGKTEGNNYAIRNRINSASEYAWVYNNIFMAEGGAEGSIYACYIGGTAANITGRSLIDYNTYFSSGSLGYMVSSIDDLDAWQIALPVDAHSINTRPVFVDTTVDLKLEDYSSLGCPVIPNVSEDINGNTRAVYTTMGAHEGIVRYDNDASPIQITGLYDEPIGPGQIHHVSAVVRNKGWDTLKTVELTWFIDGDSIATVSGTLALSLENADTVYLGTIPLAYTYAEHTIMAIVKKVNNVSDQQALNDTVRYKYTSCMEPVPSTLLIGTSAQANYPDIASAVRRMSLCGIDGKVMLLLEDNLNYTESVDLSGISATAADTLEITSLSGKADSVVLKSGVFGIKTGNMDNVYIRNITINLRGEGHGIILGSGDNVEISGCKINLDSTLGKTMTGNDLDIRHVAIYKPFDSGIANRICIRNNIITGGYNAILLVGGDSTTHGTDWILDSNTIQKGYWNSIFALYTDFLSISGNYCAPMIGATHAGVEWCGLQLQYSNVEAVQGNKIHGQGRAINYPFGMLFGFVNTYTSPAIISNNEIILAKSGYYDNTDALTLAHSSANVYHNSIAYITESGTTAVSLIYLPHTVQNVSIDIKNNSLYAARSVPIYIEPYVNATLDYNNYYTGGRDFGHYHGTDVADLSAWQTVSGQDAHSVSIRPEYLNLQQSLEITNNFSGMICPVLSAVPTDINHTPRQYAHTLMGAYEVKLSDTSAVQLVKLLNFPIEAIVNQQLSVDVEIANFGADSVESILFGYAFNNGDPFTYLWTPAIPLAPLANPFPVCIHPLTVVGDTSVAVWIEEVNGKINMYKDTVSGAFNVVPLAAFAPSVNDTVYNRLSFDVHVRIAPHTGAPVSTPVQLYVVSEAYGNTTCDTISMTASGDMYTAYIPVQYYGTKTVYELSVTDNINNSIILKDSVYTIANFEGDGNLDTVIIGTGTTNIYTNPYDYQHKYSYSRNYYMSYEIDPNQKGGVIKSIAFYKEPTSGSHVTSNVDSISFYLKAVSDSVNTTDAYIDPIADGATLVWGSARASIVGSGWKTFVLDTPFDLPAGMNLLLYCDNKDGSFNNIYEEAIFRYTATGKNTSVYVSADGNTFPPVAASENYTAYLNGNRPNIQLTRETLEPYPGFNLSILSVVSPVVSTEIACEPSYSPVQIRLTNMGTNNYDFAAKNISIGYEITDPLQAKYSGSLSVNTGTLASCRSNILELMPSIPILAGATAIKAWINSTDSLVYDDTIYYTYVSMKLGLPIDEYFSGDTMPFEFKSSVDENDWVPYTPDLGFAVQPNFGTGMLRNAASVMKMTKLSTSRQIDLYGTVNSKMEFWYYHDPSLSEMDNSYTDVVVIADDVSYRVLQLLKRSGSRQGWEMYSIDLSPYTTAQCVLIEFESMNKNAGTQQYIDRIHITSEEDLAITDILVSPQLSLCDYRNKNVYVVVAARTAQAIDFSSYQNPQLAVEITGKPIIYYPLSGILQGRVSTAFLVDSGVDFITGTTQIKAWLTLPVDNYNVNDTAKTTIVINPKFKMEIEKLSGSNLATAGFENHQKVTIKNIGNMELPAIGLILTLNDESGFLFSTKTTVEQSLLPGDSVEIAFPEAYKVPWSHDYTITVHGYLLCDSTLCDTTFSIQERVNMDDLYLVNIEQPEDDGTTIDVVGSSKEVSVRIKNRNIARVYTAGEVNIVIMLTDKDGIPTEDAPIIEGLPYITGEEEFSFLFNGKYTVPALEEYYLVVYIEATDEYMENDTLKMLRQTSVNTLERVGVSFAMEQNIPNPAKGKTIINYRIPQDGEIIFQIHSVSGQILYNKVEHVSSGEHQIELNLSDYASGIYFYSMEYKGHRIIKRMKVK